MSALHLRAIVTVFVGATNTRGSLVRAKCHSLKTITVGWDHALDSDANHRAAALKLAKQHDWIDAFHDVVGGNTLPDGKSRVWLLTSTVNA